MTPEQFCYWLQGFFELATPNHLDEEQLTTIQDHLKLVFNKVTPDRSVGDLNAWDPNFIPPGTQIIC